MMPSYVKFFIENHDEIRTVIELNRRVREELPSIVRELLHDGLKEAYRHWRWAAPDSLKLAVDSNEISWWQRNWYDEKRDCGVYFGVENISAVSLVDATSDAEKPYLFLYYLGNRKVGNLTKQILRDSISQDRAMAASQHLMLQPIDDDDGYLATQSLGSIVTIAALRDPQAMKFEFTRVARAFSESFIDIIEKS